MSQMMQGFRHAWNC